MKRLHVHKVYLKKCDKLHMYLLFNSLYKQNSTLSTFVVTKHSSSCSQFNRIQMLVVECVVDLELFLAGGTQKHGL